MSCLRFYADCPKNTRIKYAVIMARYHGKWILARHKNELHIQPALFEKVQNWLQNQ